MGNTIIKKERPILFSAPMVRAILEGRKTMTRRVVKEKVVDWPPTLSDMLQAGMRKNGPCPYGYAGDRLWVRETFLIDGPYIQYRADHPDAPNDTAWKPSIFMPRSASRILLEITDVRVERLKEITVQDCISEGIERSENESHFSEYNKFRRLWQSINGPESWAANPLVWAITFKKIEQ